MMNEPALLREILSVLGEIAPEADLSALPREADLRIELDLDSFDFLTFLTRLHERLGIDIPEAEVGRLRTLSSCVSYLLPKVERLS